MATHVIPLLVTLVAVTTAQPPSMDDVTTTLQKISGAISAKYNCSIAISFYSEHEKWGGSSGSPVTVSTAAGFTDAGIGLGKPSRAALPNDKYVWGSITKMFTGPAVLQLVDQGKVDLDSPITTYIDPLLQHVNGTTLADHFGSKIQQVHVRNLLHMTSGIHDYDGEAYATAQFANRTKDFSPLEIISKYVEPSLKYPPGTDQGYCSTNYILLGLLLASQYHDVDGGYNWESYIQRTVIPQSIQKDFPNSLFINHGTCKDHTPVHGFLQGYSTASIKSQDVWNISCAGGWTAGNYVGSVGDVSKYTYLLYNTGDPRIVSKKQVANMLNFSKPGGNASSFKFYGMGTFNLGWSIGAPVPFPGYPVPAQKGNFNAYGHVGDTYGYQSQTTYIPEDDFVITVATNVETNSQAQPADATCLAYSALKAQLDHVAIPDCTFTVPRRFIGVCSCQV